MKISKIYLIFFSTFILLFDASVNAMEEKSRSAISKIGFLWNSKKNANKTAEDAYDCESQKSRTDEVTYIDYDFIEKINKNKSEAKIETNETQDILFTQAKNSESLSSRGFLRRRKIHPHSESEEMYDYEAQKSTTDNVIYIDYEPIESNKTTNDTNEKSESTSNVKNNAQEYTEKKKSNQKVKVIIKNNNESTLADECCEVIKCGANVCLTTFFCAAIIVLSGPIIFR